MEKIKKIVKTKLSKFRDEERGDAMTILMLIGLKHYMLLYPDQSHVQMPYLKFLSEKYLVEMENPDNRPKNLLSQRKKLEQLQERYGETNRKFRPDSMAHFPFADEYGSIGDVLTGAAAIPEIDLGNMGAPGRNRLILKVFDEMRLDYQGIRISDLPEALERLGIQISSKLRRTLLKARGKNVNGPLIPTRESRMAGEPLEYMEKHVPLSLWKAIVKNFLRLRRQGIEPGHLQEVLPPLIPGRAGQRAHYDISDNEDDENADVENQEVYEDDNSSGDISSDEFDHENDARHNPHASKKHTSYNGNNEEKQPSHRPATHSSQRMHKHKAAGSSIATAGHVSRPTFASHQKITNPVQAHSRAYYRRLQRIPSRLGEVIREHRFQHQIQHVKHDKDALHTIGKRRVDVLTAHAPKLGWEDPAYQPTDHNTASTSTLRRHGFQQQQQGTDGRWSLQTNTAQERQRQKSTVRRLQQLDSGAATLEIADAFLHSQVGRELMLNSAQGAQYQDYYEGMGSEEDGEEEMTPKEAQLRATKLLGLSLPYDTKPRGKHQNNHTDNAAKLQHQQQQLQMSKSSSLQKKVDDVAATKALYEGQSGWKTTKGGWVADFGPVHTHHLYTGPDQYTPFLLDRKLSSQTQKKQDYVDHSSEERVSSSSAVTASSVKQQHTFSAKSVRESVQNLKRPSDKISVRDQDDDNEDVSRPQHRIDEADLLFARSSHASANLAKPSFARTSNVMMDAADADEEDDYMFLASTNNQKYAGGDSASRKTTFNTNISSSGVTKSEYTTSRSAANTKDAPSPVSSEDAAVYAVTGSGRGGFSSREYLGEGGYGDEEDDGAYLGEENSEEDVDALLSRLQSSVSLKDIVSEDE